MTPHVTQALAEQRPGHRLRCLTGGAAAAEESVKEAPFDLVYERAFLCALPRPRWPDWARRMAELVRPGGELAGFFYMNDNERGPPFGADRATLDRLRGGAFALAEDEAVPPGESIPVFQGREIWQVWKRPL